MVQAYQRCAFQENCFLLGLLGPHRRQSNNLYSQRLGSINFLVCHFQVFEDDVHFKVYVNLLCPDTLNSKGTQMHIIGEDLAFFLQGLNLMRTIVFGQHHMGVGKLTMKTLCRAISPH